MRFSFDLKKGVATRVLIVIAIGLMINLSIGQSNQPLWQGGVPTLWTMPANSPSHPLQYISTHWNSPAQTVDANVDGLIDKANWAQFSNLALYANNSERLQGLTPSNNIWSKGCFFVDTGSFSTGDSWQGYTTLILNTSDDTQWFNPSTGQGKITDGRPFENICGDGDGCTYSAVAYRSSQNSITNIMGSGSNTVKRFFQFPQGALGTQAPNPSPSTGTSRWIDDNNAQKGVNGDGVSTIFVSWNVAGGQTPDLELYDDYSTAGSSSNDLAVRDRSAAYSFIVSFCD